MTGRPAETWRKFNFVTPPAWAYALLILVCLGGLGFIGYAIVIAVTAQRASGYLPLTRASKRIVIIALSGPIAALSLFVLGWVLAAIIGLPATDPAASTLAGILFWIGTFLMLGALVGRLVVKPLICPRGKVYEQQPYQYDKLVELRNVHPAFVAAVNHMHQLRAVQRAAPYSPSPVPYAP